jgi:hypothetical protein
MGDVTGRSTALADPSLRHSVMMKPRNHETLGMYSIYEGFTPTEWPASTRSQRPEENHPVVTNRTNPDKGTGRPKTRASSSPLGRVASRNDARSQHVVEQCPS